MYFISHLIYVCSLTSITFYILSNFSHINPPISVQSETKICNKEFPLINQANFLGYELVLSCEDILYELIPQ